jgi:hypothetical protein
MSKKPYTYSTLIIILILNQQSLAMLQSTLSQAIIYQTTWGTLVYGLSKGLALLQIHRDEDAPQKVQTWARDILAKKNITNAHSIPLKLGDSWCVNGGSLIQIDKKAAEDLNTNLAKAQLTLDDEKQKIIAEMALLHEAKHYHNGDFGKNSLTSYFSLIPLGFCSSLLINKWNNYISILTLLFTAGLSIISTITYARYQEKEAERFAFMNLSSIEKLKITKDLYLKGAEAFEIQLRHNPYLPNRSWFENKIRSVLSNQIVSLNSNRLKNHDKQPKYIFIQKKLIDIANFIYDPLHPSAQNLADLAQECLEKRLALENC